MPTAPGRVCPRCSRTVPPRQSCPHCRRAAQARRPSPDARGYGHHHRARFRPAVLRRDPVCTCTTAGCHGPRPCGRLSTVADHYPRTRRELVAAGRDPNDPAHGRGLCQHCHNHATGTDPRTAGGWHADRETRG